MLYKTKAGKTYKAERGILTIINPDSTVKVKLGDHAMNFSSVEEFEAFLSSPNCIIFNFHKEVA